MDLRTIPELVREMEQQDHLGNTQISEYVNWSMRDEIDRIDAYVNSKHISGDVDYLGREKPFFNIVTSAVNVWYRATDIDRSNIRIIATKKEDYIASFLATIKLQEWMRKDNFGIFLNKWGRTLAKYGSAVVKFVESDGELYRDVISWNNIICDPVDFNSNPVIEKIYLTPAQLKMKVEEGWDEEYVEKLINNTKTREVSQGKRKDNKDDYIPIYEIHGNMSLYYITGNENDKDTYAQQMHIISFVETKEKGEFDDYTLFKSKESKTPYMITHLIEEDGRTLGIGAVAHLFEAQWMVNHNMKLIKDQLDLASKVFFQTADEDYVGRNAINSLENGDIMVHKPNAPLTQVNSQSHDIGSLESYMSLWRGQGQEATNVNENILGQQAKSGTAWRQVEALLQESHSLFEQMTENKGLYLENMLREYVLPFFKKKLNTKEEISDLLNSWQIKQIDKMFIPNKAKKDADNDNVERVLNGEQPLVGEELEADIANRETEISKSLSRFGNQRFIRPSEIPEKTWKDVFKNIEWKLDVDITGEGKNNQAVMTTLNTLLQTMASLNGQPMSSEMKMILNRILEMTKAISPAEMSQASIDDEQQPQQIQPTQPTQQPQPAQLPQIQNQLQTK